MVVPVVWLVVALASCVCATNVTVVRVRLSLEQEHTITLDNTIEYILEFVPDEEQGMWPSRVHVSSDGGDRARPVLLTARQRTGAQTWQLPYMLGEQRLWTLVRTLCPDDTAEDVDDPACVETGAGAGAARGQFSLHVSSACAARVAVRVRVQPARDWRLPLGARAALRTTLAAPGVAHYGWAGAEPTSVRLVAASDDDVCITLAVYNYSCPVPATREDLVGNSALRMTMQRSGAVQLARSAYPRGFFVVALMEANDDACEGEQDADSDWLWEVAVGRGAPLAARDLSEVRVKHVTLNIRASLSRRQYAVAGSATLALFVAFYAAFGALVAAQRWAPLRKFVKPKAVLADAPVVESGARTEADGSPPRRRDSTATFDSSDNSDSDEEADPAPPLPPTTTAAATSTTPPGTTAATTAVSTISDAIPADGGDVAAGENGHADRSAVQRESAPVERPFGLPARLRVAALARRRARTLGARSDRYRHTLYTVAVFYALPVVQFVAAFQIVLNVSGSLDLCYYNFLCAHPAGALSDFNHVLSNLGYLLLGALFLLQLKRRRHRRARKPRHEEYGIPAHYGLLESLGAGMMVVALLSASYHVCPNQLNFQFDTAFMYVLAVLSMVKIYQARHPDVNARAHATFGVLAALIALVVWGVLGGGALFWGLWTVLHVFTFLLLSLRIYYVGQFRLDKQWVTATTRDLRALGATARPLYSARLVLLLIANAVNWAFAIYGLFTMAADFAGHLLSVLLANTLMYMVFYLVMKLLHGERLRWYAWLFLGGAAAAWGPALYFFVFGSSDWSATPAQSRHSNHECKVLQFYDSHDLWHMLSAVALYLSFNAMLTWDDGLSAVKRTQIAVF